MESAVLTIRMPGGAGATKGGDFREIKSYKIVVIDGYPTSSTSTAS
jgi:hypothetical protein